MKSVNILFVYSSHCPHCINFIPIYNKSIELVKNTKYNINIQTLNYNNSKKHYENTPIDINNPSSLTMVLFNDPLKLSAQYIHGVPTVFIIDSNNVPKSTVEHTIIDGEPTPANIEMAAEKFIQNIINANDNPKLGSKQSGGNSFDLLNKTSMDEITYKQKYLKYKAKYEELKMFL